MKPIIISVTEDANGYIKIKKSDFEKCIMDAYECGKADGSAHNPWNYTVSRDDAIREIEAKPLDDDSGCIVV